MGGRRAISDGGILCMCVCILVHNRLSQHLGIDVGRLGCCLWLCPVTVRFPEGKIMASQTESLTGDKSDAYALAPASHSFKGRRPLGARENRA